MCHPELAPLYATEPTLTGDVGNAIMPVHKPSKDAQQGTQTNAENILSESIDNTDGT